MLGFVLLGLPFGQSSGARKSLDFQPAGGNAKRIRTIVGNIERFDIRDAIDMDDVGRAQSIKREVAHGAQAHRAWIVDSRHRSYAMRRA